MKRNHDNFYASDLTKNIIQNIKEMEATESEILDLIEDLLDYLELKLKEGGPLPEEVEKALVTIHKEIILARSWMFPEIKTDKNDEEGTL